MYWVFKQAGDLSHVADALGQANYGFLIPALVVYFAGVAVRAIRWRVLVRPVKRVSARRLFPVVVIGYMANDVLPARMGELVRAYILNRDEGISKTAGLATIFVERVFDGLVMVIFVAALGFFVPLEAGLQQVLRVASVIFVAVLLATFSAALAPERALSLIGTLLQFVSPRLRRRFAPVAEHFVAGLSVLQNPMATLSVLVLSVVAWLCEAVMYYLVGLGFSLDLGFAGYVLVTAVANLGTMIPSSPGYVGTFEALVTYTLHGFNISADLAISYTVVLHVALLVPITLLGFYYMWRRHVTLASLRPQRGDGSEQEFAQ
jgi:uncharacterized protein (TIRG00374 family)